MMEFLDAHYQPLLLILISIFCFAAASLKKQQKNYLLKSGIKTTGTIVDHELRKSNRPGGMPTYHPIVEFEDNENKLRQLICDFGFSFKLFKQNQQVEIYYDATDIRKFIINDSKAKPFEYIFPLAGSVLLIAGIYFLI